MHTNQLAYKVLFSPRYVRIPKCMSYQRAKSKSILFGLVTLRSVFLATAYESLEARKKSRAEAWEHSGWTKCVKNTGNFYAHFP